MDWIVLIGTGVVTFILWIVYKCERGGPYYEMKHFPGPPIPFIGHSIPTDPKGLTDWIMKLVKDYGSGARFKVATVHAIVVSSPEHMEAVLADRDNITKGFPYDFIEAWFGKGLLTSTNEDWHRQRKLLTPTFHFKVLNDYIPIMNEAASKFTEKLSDVAGKGAVPIWPYVTKCTLDIICETSMGRKINAQDLQHQHYYLEAIQNFTDFVVERVGSPLYWNDWIYCLFKSGRQHYKYLKTLHNFTNQTIAERESTAPEVSSTNDTGSKRRPAFLDLLLNLYRDGKLTKKEVKEQTDTFMFEGHDTTAAGLQWLMYCLGRNPEWQERCQQEIDQIVGSEPLSYDCCKQLKTLEMCIKEAQRLYPSVPLISRTVTKSLKLDDQLTVPPTVTINLNTLALHRDPNVYPDPEVFDPNRFLPENVATRHPFAYVPFSAGLRNCIAPQEEKEVGWFFNFILRPVNEIMIEFTKR